MTKKYEVDVNPKMKAELKWLRKLGIKIIWRSGARFKRTRSNYSWTALAEIEN